LLRVEVTGDRNCRVVLPHGDLDVLTIARLRDALHECTAMGTRLVVVDLAAVGFLAVCGLTALLEAHRTCEATGARLRLRHVRPFIRRILRLADLDTVLVDEATLVAETGPGPGPERARPGPDTAPAPVRRRCVES
jgi:anti-anti-sigma factor